MKSRFNITLGLTITVMLFMFMIAVRTNAGLALMYAACMPFIMYYFVKSYRLNGVKILSDLSECSLENLEDVIIWRKENKEVDEFIDLCLKENGYLDCINFNRAESAYKLNLRLLRTNKVRDEAYKSKMFIR